jgi:gamma-glutamyltranspeptidase/glutathione hydrolase
LRDYTAIWRAPIGIRFGDYEVFAPAPPSSGGLVLGETLNIIGPLDLAASGFQSVKTLHLLTESQRRAAIDDAKAIGDPPNARIPYRDLLSAEHANTWRASINASKVTPTVMLAEAAGQTRMSGPHSTIAISDAAGNVAVMTTTNGGEFVVPGFGFVLNNAMSAFGAGVGINEFASSKRPATTISPVIVLKKGRPYIALASDEPSTATQVIINSIVFEKPLYDSVAAARYHQGTDPDQIDYEKPLAPKATIDALNAMGHAVFARDAIGEVGALQFDRGKIVAVADPRYGGAAGGY